MKKTRSILVVIIIFFVSNAFLSCQENNTKAVGIVNAYLKKQLSSNKDEYYKARNSFHPDLAILGGEIARFHVVSLEYTIVKERKEKMNIDLMEPKDEEITIVTVLFKRYCDIYNNEFIPEKKDYTRDYFLSESTGELLILDYSESMWETVSLGYAIQWASVMKNKSKEWSELYAKLITLQEQQKLKDK